MDRSDVLFWPLPFSLRADDTCNYVALMLSYLYLTRMHTWHEFSFIRCAYMEEAFSWSVVLQLISDHDWPAVSQQCHAFLFSILASQSPVCIVAVLDSYCTSIMEDISPCNCTLGFMISSSESCCYKQVYIASRTS